MKFPAKIKRKIFGKPKPVVTVLRLSGVIGDTGGFRREGLTLRALSEPLEAAFAYKKAKAVALVINSPGGSPVQSSLIGKRIRALAKEHKKHVIVFVEDVAASGGYWLAAMGDEIYIDESSILGSIGVVSQGFGFPELLEKIGVQRRVYTSGKSKSQLDPFKAEQEQDVVMLKDLQNLVHEQFINVIKERRGSKLASDMPELFDGSIFVGARAVEKGLADGFGETRSKLQEKYGKNVKLKVIPSMPQGLLQKLSGKSSGIASPNLASELVSAVENRLHWAKYGI